jgi:autotransporter-associated beta strand protein/parallel beta-helix repeat protein
LINEVGTVQNVVAGNRIGTTADGLAALGNGDTGIRITGGATTNRIGTNGDGVSDMAERNIISGNTFAMSIDGGTTAFNTVAGNYIGLNALGAPLGNTLGGVSIHVGAHDNTIGGPTPAFRNVIAANAGSGTFLGNGVFIHSADQNVVQNNFIGTDVTGTLDYGNAADGILVTTNAAKNRIEENVIAGNDGFGIEVTAAASGTRIIANSIFDNGGLGINLIGPADLASGVTPNDALDADSGPNGLQNFPVISTAIQSGVTLTITGTLSSAPSSSFALEFFSSEAPDASGFGEGARYLGTAAVTTDAAGDASFSVSITAAFPLVGHVVTATARDASGNTSELSAAVAVTPPPTVTLSGTVYDDRNGNGLFDAGEAGIPNVTVKLAVQRIAGFFIVDTQITDASGDYSFLNVPPGEHIIAEYQPADFLDGQEHVGSLGGFDLGNDNFAVEVGSAGGVGTGYDFGEELPSSLSGTVFVDFNQDGMPESFEQLPNVLLTLWRENPDGSFLLIGNQATDAGGNYHFDNLRPGTYRIEELQPQGFDNGQERAGTLGGDTSAHNVIAHIVVPGGSAGTGYDFPERLAASLSGGVFLDRNNSGTADSGDDLLPNVMVYLFRESSDGSLTGVQTIATDGNGAYLFKGVLAGTYRIVAGQPADLNDGAAQAGSLGGDTSVNNVIAHIVVPTSAGGTGYFFTERPAGSVSGGVFLDHDNDDVLGFSDSALPNVTVRLRRENPDGTVSAGQVTTTDAIGNFSFAGVLAGTYQLVELQPPGVTDGPELPGSLGGDTSASFNDVIFHIVVTPGAAATGYYFFERPLSSVGGYVFLDKNNDGIFNLVDEQGIPNVTVQLSGVIDGPGGGAVLVQTQTTDARGNYSFNDLPPGTYSIVENQPAGYSDGPEQVGSLGGEVTVNDLIASIVVPPAASATGYNFVERPLSWTGQGQTVNWSDPGNWGGTTPIPGGRLLFGPGAPTRSFNDLPADFPIASIAFTGGDYTVTGNRIKVGGSGITVQGGNVTLNLAMQIDPIDLPIVNQIDPIELPIVVAPGSQLTLAGVLSGPAGLYKDGLGTLVLSGANTYRGTTAIKEGTLSVQNPLALAIDAGPAEIFGGATLELKGGITIVGGLLRLHSAIDAGPAEIVSSAGSNTWSGPIDLAIDAGPAEIVVAAGSQLALSGVIGGAGGIDKLGAGTLVLSGANTYAGATHVAGGVLNLRNSLALGCSRVGTEVLDGARLELQGDIAVTGETLAFRGGSTELRSVSGLNSWSGAIQLPPGTDQSFVVFKVEAGSENIVSGPVSGGSGAGLTKEGAGTLVLSGANTYAGKTIIEQGALRIENAMALGSTAGRTELIGGATLESRGDIVLNEPLVAVGSPPGSRLPSVTVRNLGGLLQINQSLQINPLLDFEIPSGTIVVTSAIAGNDDIVVEGPGTLVLTADNAALNGSITLLGGTLLVNGSWANVPVHVLGGVLGGTGVVGPITPAGGAIQGAIYQSSPLVAGQIDLVVGGTAAADSIGFNPAPGGRIEATLNGTSLGAFTPTGRLIVYAGGGDDDVQVAGSIGTSAWLYGEAGNDRLKGGAGNNVLLGGAGDDLLVGGAGRDLLIGGDGSDRLVGNADDDILIAGTTAYDGNAAALDAVMAEWTSGRAYGDRIANLQGAGRGVRLNGDVLLTVDGVAASVRDDGAADVLTGSAGRDWFFANLDAGTRDKLTDLAAAEFASDLDFIG